VSQGKTGVPYLQCYVEEFNAAVAAGRDELILMDLAPGTIVQSILCIESKAQSPAVSNNLPKNAVYKHTAKPTEPAPVTRKNKRQTTDGLGEVRIHSVDALRRQIQDMHPSIPNETKVLRGSDCEERIVVGAEGQGIGVEGQRLECVWHRASDGDDDGKIEQRGHVNVIRKNLGETFGVGNDWIYGRGDFGVSIRGDGVG